MANCLVTGYKGYIGSRLYKVLEEQGHTVRGLDIVDGNDVIEVLGDDLNELKYDFVPEYIFHLACYPRVLYSMEHPVSTMKNNVPATSAVLSFAKRAGAKRVIYSSSSSVVGNGTGPVSPYALQKLISEWECKLYADVFGVDTVSLRYFNVYSEDQPASGPYATAVANWMKALRNNIDPFITGDGEQRRDMVHVQDVIAANIFCMNYDGMLNGAAYDVGTGSNISLNELKAIVLNEHSSIVFEDRPPRPGDVMLTKAKTAGLKQLGWEANISIISGMKSCFSKENIKG